MSGLMSGKEIHVRIGEVRIAQGDEVLKAILGSCVGIGIIWKEKGLCGLAHCLLGESPVKTFSIGARYVDQAIPSLIALMKIRPEDLAEVEVILAGGGNMTSSHASDPGKLVGSHNFRVAVRELNRHGLRITRQDHAREEGRRIALFARNGSYSIEPIPRFVGVA